MTHDWVVTYQYQGAVYDKRIGDSLRPPHRAVPRPAPRPRPARTITPKRATKCPDDCNNHLENLAVIAYELAAADMHWLPPDALRNVDQRRLH